MKRSIAFLFMFGMMAAAALAQGPKIRVPTKPAETPEQQMAKRQGFFPVNTRFEKDKKYYSEDNRYFFQIQSDGNLVVYKAAGVKAIWQSGTSGKAVKSCVFQGDGNLVIYGYTGKALWAAGQNQRTDSFISGGPKFMVLQSDGNLVIYDSAYPDTSRPIWASNTFEKN